MPITNLHPHFTEWYTVNGESMANYGWAIESISTGLPDRKGQNVTSPIIHGDIFREKRFGPRTETWNIWVTDANPTTNAVPSTENGRRAQFNENINYLNTVLNCLTPNGLNNGSLEIKKNHLSTPASPVNTVFTGYGEVLTSYSYEDPKQFNMAMLSVEVNYPNPLWSGASYTANLTGSSGAGTSGTITSANIGTAPTTAMTITITATGGSVVNPRVTNSTLSNYPSQIGYTGTLTVGQSVVINTSAYTIYQNSNNVISGLFRSGFRQDWFEVFPGMNNTIVCSSTSGTFSVSIVYNKVYF